MCFIPFAVWDFYQSKHAWFPLSHLVGMERLMCDRSDRKCIICWISSVH